MYLRQVENILKPVGLIVCLLTSREWMFMKLF